MNSSPPKLSKPKIFKSPFIHGGGGNATVFWKKEAVLNFEKNELDVYSDKMDHLLHVSKHNLEP